MAIMLFMLFAMIGCGQTGEGINYGQQHEIVQQPVAQPAPSAVNSSLGVGSVEEFLYAYRAVKEGRATGNLANLAAAVDFISLNELHVLTNLPETYRLHGIEVDSGGVGMWFFPEDAFTSMDAMHNARDNRHFFHFSFTRWDLESPMAGVSRQFGFTDEDSISGRYYFRESAGSVLFYWAYGREVLTMRLPRTLHGNHGISAFGIDVINPTSDTAHMMIPFTQTTTINLHDEALVTALIGNLYELTFNMGSASGEFAAFDTMAPINIPAGANINSFVAMHHEGLSIPGLSRNGGQFLGWYLDANFTIPLIDFLTTMPARNTTLYARWQYDEN